VHFVDTHGLHQCGTLQRVRQVVILPTDAEHVLCIKVSYRACKWQTQGLCPTVHHCYMLEMGKIGSHRVQPGVGN
jgi:hypothetical protein